MVVPLTEKDNKWVYLTDWRFKKACPDIHTFLIRSSFIRNLYWGGQSVTKLSSPLHQDLILYPAHPPQCVNEIISICINVRIQEPWPDQNF